MKTITTILILFAGLLVAWWLVGYLFIFFLKLLGISIFLAIAVYAVLVFSFFLVAVKVWSMN